MKQMKWYDVLQYIAMICTSSFLLVNIHFGIYAAIALGGVSFVKLLAQWRIGNPTLTWPMRVALMTPILYWLCYVLSVVSGLHPENGSQILTRKAILLIYPLCILLTDTSYIKSIHLRILGYAFLLSCMLSFFYYCGIAIGKMSSGIEISQVINESFDPRHHAYSSLYLVAALAFVYIELTRNWKSNPRWIRYTLMSFVPILILYTVIVNSRAGIIVLWVVLAICSILMSRRKWWHGVLLFLLVGGYCAGLEAVLPGHTNRVTQTIENMEADKGDARIDINNSTSQLVMQSPVFGYGAAEYQDEIVEQYEKDGYKRGVESRYNAHNQYFETIISTGVIGLLLLLVWLLSPIWLSIWQMHRLYPPALLLTVIVVLNLAVESMLERQMGLLFVGWFYPYIFLCISVLKRTKTTDVHSKKLSI